MSGPRRVALLVAYRGDGYSGFQRQAGFRTVQEDLEEAWSSLTGERAVVHGSGRTDAGVHAWGQVVHLSTWSELPLRKLRFPLFEARLRLGQSASHELPTLSADQDSFEQTRP